MSLRYLPAKTIHRSTRHIAQTFAESRAFSILFLVFVEQARQVRFRRLRACPEGVSFVLEVGAGWGCLVQMRACPLREIRVVRRVGIITCSSLDVRECSLIFFHTHIKSCYEEADTVWSPHVRLGATLMLLIKAKGCVVVFATTKET